MWDIARMKTTIDIPDELVREAMEGSGAKTKREVVMLALQDFNRRIRQARLAEELGNSDTFMSFEELMELRSKG